MKCWRLSPNQELIVTIVFLLAAQPFAIAPQEMKSLIVIINNDCKTIPRGNQSKIYRNSKNIIMTKTVYRKDIYFLTFCPSRIEKLILC
jgi:hypothetical protein